MVQILSKAVCFIAVILLGWSLRRIGFFKKDDFTLLSKIVLRITLPAAIVTSYAGRQIEPSMLLLSLLGLGLGIMYIMIGYLLAKKKGPEAQAFHVLNISGYNIGNFTMPFIQGFLGSNGVFITSLFDTGNAFICLGSSFSIAAMIRRGEKLSFINILRDLVRSVPFDTYIIMTVLALFRINLPNVVLDFAGIIANANVFMAMLMLGVGFHISGDRAQTGDIVRILGIRYGIAVIVALACFFLLPYDFEIRRVLAILVFSPIASAAPAFTGELGCDFGLSSAINSLSIVIGIICIVGIMLVLV